MIQTFTKRLAREDRGFTLIELMVVVLIIAILIAIAIPTFLGARRRAQDRAAQSSLRNAVTTAAAIFTDNENYDAATQAAMNASEPSLSFVGTAASTGQNVVSHATASLAAPTNVHERFFAAVLSRSGTCWFVQDIKGPAAIANAGTTWASGTPATCNTAAVPAFDAAGWATNP